MRAGLLDFNIQQTRRTKNDFLQNEFKQLNLAVAFDEPLERLRKLIELLRSQLAQRAQREIDDRQMRVRGGSRNIGIQRGGFSLNCRIHAFGQFGELRRAHRFIRVAFVHDIEKLVAE